MITRGFFGYCFDVRQVFSKCLVARSTIKSNKLQDPYQSQKGPKNFDAPKQHKNLQRTNEENKE